MATLRLIQIVRLWGNSLPHNLEYRLKTGSGQDRSVNLQHARTTDKSNQNGWIYSLVPNNNLDEIGVRSRIVARGPDKQDPFDQFVDVTFKIYGVALALNSSAGRILLVHEKL